MNKYLLTLGAAVALVGSAWADSVTFDFVNEDYGMTRLSGSTNEYNPSGTVIANEGVELVTDGNTRLWSDGLRFYKESKVTISAPGANIIGIELISSKDAVITSNFAFTPAGAEEGEYSNWNGDVAELVMDCTVTKGNAAVGKMVVHYQPTGAPVLKPAELAFAETSFTAEEGSEFTAPVLANPNNLAVTYSSTNEAVATVDAEGKVTLTGVGTTTITAESEATAEFRAGKASYTLTVTAKPAIVTSMLEWAEKCGNKGDRGIMNFESIVTYVNGAYVYFVDERFNPGLIYGNAGGYVAGDFLPSGWMAENAVYNGLPEIKIIGDAPVAEPGEPLPYDNVFTIGTDDINRVVRVQNITFAEDTPSGKTTFVGTDMEGNEITFYNQFTVASVEAGLYNVVAVGATYNGKFQAYVIAFEQPSTEEPKEPKIVFGNSDERERVEEYDDWAYVTTVDNASDTVAIKFTNLPEGCEVYYVDLLDMMGGYDLAPKRITIGDIEEMFGMELTKAENDEIPNLGVGMYYYAWWYAINGEVKSEEPMESMFIVNGPDVDLSGIKMVVGNNIQPTDSDEYDFEYNCKVANEEDTVKVVFEDVPEGVEVYFAVFGGGDWEPYKRIPAEFLGEYGFQLLEDNTISLGVGQYICSYVFAVNGQVSEEQEDTAPQFIINVEFDPTVAVAALEAEGAAAGYYDLSGKRVENPSNGLFIRMQNGKAQTVIVK